MKLEDLLERHPVVLTEGSVIERLRRDPEVTLDPFILHAALVYSDDGRRKLSSLYKQYLDIGRTYSLPMIVCTPTWRANQDRVGQVGLARDVGRVNADCVRFVCSIVSHFADYGSKIAVGGLIGCKGDAYKPKEALSSAEAVEFHEPQVRALAQAGVDFLIGATFPAVSEALGTAMAMARSEVPYVLSFVVQSDGTLLDGIPLDEAMTLIDAIAVKRPSFYMVNCVHPDRFIAAWRRRIQMFPPIQARLLGLQANTSGMRPDELDALPYLDTMQPEAFAEAMIDVHQHCGIRVLGGCCGTDNRHIECLARRVAQLSGISKRKILTPQRSEDS